MSLHLVRRLAGAELAAATARQTDYQWQHSGGAAQQDVAADAVLALHASIIRQETKA
jgi:transcriptional regulator GlxA family with amidase domain